MPGQHRRLAAGGCRGLPGRSHGLPALGAGGKLFTTADPRAGESFLVGKLSLGYVYDFSRWNHLKFGIGSTHSSISVPGDCGYLRHDPTSDMVFAGVRLRRPWFTATVERTGHMIEARGYLQTVKKLATMH